MGPLGATALTALVSSAVGALVSAVVVAMRSAATKEIEAREDQKEWEQAMTSGMRSLLRSEIIRAHHAAMREGRCSTVDKEVMQRTYESYHALGGNGVATALYEETMALPTVED